MIFNRSAPSDERAVLVVTIDMKLIQGHWYDEEDDYYDDEGELLECALGWAELPVIEFE
tara:strand:+ start:304 stop:480 length:177 start_codon:yes stop_codon:yes gene_type:complete